MTLKEEAVQLHQQLRGKISVKSNVTVKDRHALSIAYTPGVAEPCLMIQKDPSLSYELTRRWNMALVVTDGTAVLGLGDIGPEAGMPVMEGKCVLFKEFADVDAFPLCIRSKDVDDIVNTVALIAGSFGGVNLEDISAPRCFEIEEKLKQRCDIPIFHDDQHGTAIVVVAALINALRVVGKRLDEVHVVLNGCGAAGTAISKHILHMGVKHLILCDKDGIIYEGKGGLNPSQVEMSRITNREMRKGNLSDALQGADVFIGVSAPGIVTEDMIRSMAPNPVVFAMANPVPEIMPELAKAAGAAVVGTGRSDCDNQINNVLAFPGIFRGAFDVRASDINTEMKVAASYAIADIITDADRSADYIIPAAFDERVVPAVAKAVARAAVESGVARLPLPEKYQ